MFAQSPRATGVYVAPVQSQLFTDTVEALGTLKANENVVLTATVTELVTAVNFTDGQRVTQGDVLVQMDDSEEVAQLAEAQSRVQEAQLQVNRLAPLIDRGSASKRAYDESVSDLNAAKARARAAQSRIDQRRIVAPFDGVVGLRNTSAGALLQPGVMVTTIDDDRTMNLDFSVPEVFLSTLTPGLAIQAAADAYPERLFQGSVASVDARVDPITRSVVARARIDNADLSLKPGMLMRVELAKNPRQALVVQEEALIMDGRRVFVLVAVERDDQWIAEKRQVEVGARRKGEAEIISGLSANDKVITHGTQKAKDGAAIEVLAIENDNQPLSELLQQQKVKANSPINATAQRES